MLAKWEELSFSRALSNFDALILSTNDHLADFCITSAHRVIADRWVVITVEQDDITHATIRIPATSLWHFSKAELDLLRSDGLCAGVPAARWTLLARKIQDAIRRQRSSVGRHHPVLPEIVRLIGEHTGLPSDAIKIEFRLDLPERYSGPLQACRATLEELLDNRVDQPSGVGVEE